ncbi:hypothetical protein [Azorhizophilus paspali]|uniref:ATPase F1/V1/A1 complex alpha/beta subunit N-terminal domain-containing protein n=1 Tax=Azorhizophilus paspali TaxID=69963 RepID=A0ABV6SLC5_AZOPA
MVATQLEGLVSAVRGAVIDVTFAAKLPPIGDALAILRDDGEPLAEVQAYLDARRVRAIALAATSAAC